MILLLGTMGASLLVNLATGYLIFVLIGLIGFLYGGFLGVFPALTADFWGLKNMGTNYGIVLLGFGIGAVSSSYIAGYYKNLATQSGNINDMFPAFMIAAGAALIGALFMFLLKPPGQKKDSE